MDLETILLSSSYLGIFLLMIANGFFSFPSSQVLYILVGYFVGTGYLSFLPASLIGAVGNTIGNVLLYEAIRRKGVSFMTKIMMVKDTDLKKVEMVFRKRGPWFLFVAKLLPSIKVFVPIPPAIGKMRRDLFATIMFFASWVWSFIFIGIGYFFGKNAGLFRSYGIILMIVAATIVYLFYRYMNSSEILNALEDERAGNADTPKQ
jgi:membrane protein DedA with SNARE-associated domain